MLPSARNMLIDCAGAPDGGRVLICHEPAQETYYDPAFAPALAEATRALGFRPTLCEVPYDPEGDSLSPALIDAMRDHDVAVFLARLGDQIRFHSLPPGCAMVVSYALDVESFAGDFGRLPHAAMRALKGLADGAVASAHEVRITCPAGTDVTGHALPQPEGAGDTGIARFPLSVMTAIPAGGFSGRVALPGFLTGTGAHYYAPYSVFFDGPVHALLRAGRLAGFEGAPADVARAEAQYDHVAARYGIDRDAVHSWHAGIHPACAYAGRAVDDLPRWGGSAFGNPRVLHFHTCGAEPPGEISWNLLDATVTLDGVALWDAGRFRPERLRGGPALLAAHPALAAALANPDPRAGL